MCKQYEEKKQIMRDGTLLEIWNDAKKDIKLLRHAIIGYETESDVEKQDRLMKENEIQYYFACRCRNKATGKHKHRHILVKLPETIQNSMGNRNFKRDYNALWTVMPDKKMKAINCELHLKNVFHYLHCVKSSQSRDFITGMRSQDGHHEHHSFDNPIPELLHDGKKCLSMRKKMSEVLEPRHDPWSCPCNDGLWKVWREEWIKTTPKITWDVTDPAFKRQLKETKQVTLLIKLMLLEHNKDKYGVEFDKIKNRKIRKFMNIKAAMFRDYRKARCDCEREDGLGDYCKEKKRVRATHHHPSQDMEYDSDPTNSQSL